MFEQPSSLCRLETYIARGSSWILKTKRREVFKIHKDPRAWSLNWQIMYQHYIWARRWNHCGIGILCRTEIITQWIGTKRLGASDSTWEIYALTAPFHKLGRTNGQGLQQSVPMVSQQCKECECQIGLRMIYMMAMTCLDDVCLSVAPQCTIVC